MALRTLQYAGNKTWTGQLSFCGQTFDLTVECLGTDWRVTCGGHQDTIPSTNVGRVQINGRWYLNLFGVWLAHELGLDPWTCPDPTGFAECRAEIYVPEGNISCGG